MLMQILAVDLSMYLDDLVYLVLCKLDVLVSIFTGAKTHVSKNESSGLCWVVGIVWPQHPE